MDSARGGEEAIAYMLSWKHFEDGNNGDSTRGNLFRLRQNVRPHTSITHLVVNEGAGDIRKDDQDH